MLEMTFVELVDCRGPRFDTEFSIGGLASPLISHQSRCNRKNKGDVRAVQKIRVCRKKILRLRQLVDIDAPPLIRDSSGFNSFLGYGNLFSGWRVS